MLLLLDLLNLLGVGVALRVLKREGRCLHARKYHKHHGHWMKQKVWYIFLCYTRMESHGQFTRTFISGIELVHSCIQFRVHSPHLRSGTCDLYIYDVIFVHNTIFNITGHACRTRVIAKLAKQFASPADAEHHYFATSSSGDQVSANPSTSESTLSCVNTPATSASELLPCGATQDPLSTCLTAINKAPPEDCIKIVSRMFSKCLSDKGVMMSMPEDFLHFVILALKNLHANQRSNILYSLAKRVGTMRSDGSDTLFPLKRMPAGLVEYCVNFSVANSIVKVQYMCIFFVNNE